MSTIFKVKQAIIKTALYGKKVRLRLVTLDDCNETYLNWLQDVNVNRFLETRWEQQTLESIELFVTQMMHDEQSYLFAIIENQSGQHIGNIKLGPCNFHHHYADLSYFIGDKSMWGRGFSTEAVYLVSQFGFNQLNLRWIYAGLYGKNVASQRTLEKAGFIRQAVFSQRLCSGDTFDDHLWYGLPKSAIET